MVIRPRWVLALVPLVLACSPAQEGAPTKAAEPAASGSAEVAVVVGLSKDDGKSGAAALDASIAALEKRPEVDAQNVEVRHILIGVKTSNPRTQAFKYDEAAARVKAAEVLAEIRAGTDFWELMKKHTDDRQPGSDPSPSYTMTTGAGDMRQGIYPRRQMAAAFGDVGWRLEAGEVGIAPPHPQKSPFGFHIIQRLK